MSAILFHPSRLVYELGLHSVRPVGAATIESGTSQNTSRLRAESIIPDLPVVMLRPAADRRRRVELQHSA